MNKISCYYQAPIPEFLTQNSESILGVLAKNNEFPLTEAQRNTWIFEIEQLRKQLSELDGHILFEYTIPRIGKRIDIVLIIKQILFVIEYKVGSKHYDKTSTSQLMDYALDLKYFHEGSHNLPIITILISTQAEYEPISFIPYPDKIYKPILSNGQNLKDILIASVNNISGENLIPPTEWINSRYKPTPSIIEAAQALYENHSVEDISRSEAGIYNLSETVNVIENIIEESKVKNLKSICFITGVPGSGKTLAGLDIASHWHDVENDQHAVFLSGNGPLVKILQEALTRNSHQKAKNLGVNTNKSHERRKVSAFIQNVHHFRDAAWNNQNDPPIEHVTIFDEAQRAWNAEKTIDFMNRKKGVQNFNQSEPAFLISAMDRHKDWAVIICLVGNGQEIYSGEGGISQWFDALSKNYINWNIHVSEEMGDETQNLENQITYHQALHLAVSTRSFRSEQVSELIHQILLLDNANAHKTYEILSEKYPFFITRNLEEAKKWLRKIARGNERYGLVTSSNAKRLRPEGFNVYEDIEVENWFLNPNEDVRSSYSLENVATEFDIQGLELDWVCVGWGADFRHNGRTWEFKRFRGTAWQNINKEIDQNYLLNTYRVLLTRARQGMVIFVPNGDKNDRTRLPEFYDHTHKYLKSIGIKDLTNN